MTKLMLPRGYRDAELLHDRLHTISESKHIRRAKSRALRQFHQMSERVPAYKDFLKSRKFSPKSVINFSDFSRIPPINKDNYLNNYPKDMLCWDGEFANKHWVISTTSGSTGKPYYFPRENTQDWQYAISAELYLRNNFKIHKRSTLYIVAFPMGAWIGGLFTYEALKIVAQQGDYKLSIITPGIHKQEVISAVKQLADKFDQVIIGAYAPFLKDIIDDGTQQGVNWKKINVGFVFSAEAFTEHFRDYVINSTEPQEPLLSTLNHYGTVDLGTMAHETPESILIRRRLVDSHSLGSIFPEHRKQPTLAQYDPNLFFFESETNNLLCTSYSGIPLLRYDLKDYGGVIGRGDLHSQLTKQNINIKKLISKEGINLLTWNLPFVYVYERNDISVSYYAFLVYPDPIRRALQEGDFTKQITGKFSMLVEYSTSGRQKLNIHIERKHGVLGDTKLHKKIKESIHKYLIHESSEYRETFSMMGTSVKPVIYTWDYESEQYFKAGSKQKWVIK